MKLNGSNFGPSVAARVLAAIGYLLTASASLGEALSFRWRTEVSSAAPYEAQAMQGESFALEATLVQYGAPLTGEATATFYYQTKQMAATEWFSAPAAWDAATATASVTWSPALDVGQSAYRWFFGIDTAQGHNYRAYGTLRLKPSPGFSPALLEPIDLRAQLKAELYAQLQAELSAAFAADLQAEAAAREAADGAITEAVNALKGNLAAHNHDGAYLKLTGGTMSGTILSALSKASDPGLTITLGKGDRYYAKHTQAGIQARRALSEPEEFYAFFSVSGTNQIARLGDLEPLATKAALAAKANLEHTHEMGDVDGLEAALAAKAALSHTHSQYLTSFTETDPTIAAWAKAATKPTYNWTEILNRPTTWDWANLTNKPTTFTPATHSHDGTYLKLTGGTLTGTLNAPEIDMKVDNSIYHFNIKASPSNFEVAPVLGFYLGQNDNRVAGFSPGAADTRLSFIKGEDPRNQKVAFGHNLTKDRIFIMKNAYIADAYMGDRNWWTFSDYGNELRIVKEGKSPNEYATKAHTHAIADTTGLQAALDSLAPLSSVTCTTNDVTYIWQWDEAAGTFALVARE